MHYDHRFFEIEATIFQNNIQDFIFQKPDSLPVLTIRGAFPAFSYAQTAAILRGGDFTIEVKPLKNWVWKTKASTLFALNKTQNEWLPLMPSDRVETELRLDNQSFRRWKQGFGAVSFSMVKKQNRIPLSISDFQAPPSGYGLVGLTFGGNIKMRKQPMEIILKGDNLFNNPYRDYLDRMRYFSYAVGRNISLKVKIII